MKHIFSKTVIGAALVAAGRIIADPRNPQAWAEGAGIVMTALGIRDAIGKNGNGK